MNEREFLTTLEERAIEQEKIIKDMILPNIFAPIAIWLGNHPWRILIPLAFLLTLLFRSILGKPYDDFILKIFGKL